MTDISAEEAAALLRRHGLTHPIIDPTETAADLSERTELNDSLDSLLDGRARRDPTVLDTGWPA